MRLVMCLQLSPLFLFFLAILGNITLAVKGIPVLQTGKLNMWETFQDWSCSSGCSLPLNCRLPICTNVAFPQAFSGSVQVQVHVSISHGEEFSRVHSPSAVWVQSISTRGFEVCSRETGTGSNKTGIINWLAYQSHPKMMHGSVTFQGIWTTESKCDKVTFSQSFGGRPFVFVSAKYARNTKPEDSMHVWLENVNSGSFEVCIREFLPFDGKHQDTIVDWFAFLGNGSEFNFTLVGDAFFPNAGNPTADDNYGFCQQVQFNTTFYASPVVLVSVHHDYDRKVKNHIPPEYNIITTWVEEVGLTAMRICVKDLSGSGSKHDPLSVSYVVIGDLNPCLDVHCPSFGVCKTSSAHTVRCECYEDCPSYHDPVCTANGTTYDNKCWHELYYCRGLENNLVYHPGSCEGFPFVHGRVGLLRVPKWSDSSCRTVAFPPYRFYPDKPVHVQITINHMNLNDSETVHDAITSWTENINTKNFTVCAMQAGRKRNKFNPFATVDWLAYQGAPTEGMTGEIKMQKWWSGTKCEDVTFPKNKFEDEPVVLTTAEHLRTGKEYDAALIWTEDVTKDSFTVCLRELQNFDGKHEDISVNWLAFSKLYKPPFSEHGSVTFPNANPPTDENNNAFCQFVQFARSYNITPSVLISANHSTTASGNLAPVHNGIGTWIENKNTSGFRTCVKELYVTRYDPLSVSFAVVTDICDPGWSYFNGYCYFTSLSCTNWITAVHKCRQQDSVLVDVSSNEENVYIQHRHNGAKSWLGLNDRAIEGNFTWVDRGERNFTAWAKNQPNNFKEEDCVHALGVKYNYEWNDVRCSDCHPYTCKKAIEKTAKRTTTKQPSTTEKATTTKQPETTTKPTTTKQPETTTKPTTTKQPETTTKPTTTKQPETTTKPTTTKQPSTAAKRTTTKKPSTTEKATTTKQPETTTKPTTTKPPSTTEKVTTANQGSTTAKTTTTKQTSTNGKATTTKQPSTTAKASTTKPPSTTAKPTTPFTTPQLTGQTTTNATTKPPSTTKAPTTTAPSTTQPRPPTVAPAPLKCSVAIVGGGLGGLLMAYALLASKNKTNETNVCVFEREDRLGGKIYDFKFTQAPDVPVGLGDWNIFGDNYLEQDLVYYLDIQADSWVRKTHRVEARGVFADSFDSLKLKAFPSLLNRVPMNNKTLEETAMFIYDAARNYTQFSTAEAFLSYELSPEGAKLMKEKYGFSGDYVQAINPLSYRTYLEKKDFVIISRQDDRRPKKGMSEFITTLAQKVRDRGGKIYLKETITSIDKREDKFVLQTTNFNVKANKTVITAGPTALKKITGDVMRSIIGHDIFKSIVSVPAFHGAAVYEKAWWNDSVAAQKNNSLQPLEMFISRSNCLGITMPYKGVGPNGRAVLHTIANNGGCSDYWGKTLEISAKKVDKELKRALKYKFQRLDVPDPLETKYKYWDEGFWFLQKPGADFSLATVKKWAMRPLTGQDVFLVDRAFYSFGGWLDDTIQSSIDALKEGWNLDFTLS